MQSATFLINYTGRPFMQPLRDNALLLRGALIMYCVAVVAATGWSSDLTYYLELVELPTLEFKREFTAWLYIV